MSEIELIIKYNSLKKHHKEICLNLQIEENLGLLEEKSKIDGEIQIIIEYLKKCETTLLKLKVSALKGVVSEIINSLKYNVNGLRLSLNQGMNYPNYLFFKLIQDFNYAFQTESGGYSIPNLYFGVNSTFEHEDLKKLFVKIQQELNQLSITDYSILFDFHEKSVKEIIEMAKQYELG